MPRLAPLAVAAILLLAACGGEEKSPDEAGSKEALARLAFQALQTGEFGAQVPGIPVAADIEWTLEKVAENAPDEAEKSREHMARSGGVAKVVEQGMTQSEKAFERALELSRPMFDWSKAAFRGVDQDLTKVRERFGFKAADIYFAVAVGDQTYDFVLMKCVETPRGWLSAGGVSFRAPGSAKPDSVREKKLKANLQNIDVALRMYVMIHGSAPDTLEVLTKVDSHSGEPFIDRVPTDPWGNALFYERSGQKEYLLASGGPDGKVGTDDDIAWPPKAHGGAAPHGD